MRLYVIGRMPCTIQIGLSYFIFPIDRVVYHTFTHTHNSFKSFISRWQNGLDLSSKKIKTNIFSAATTFISRKSKVEAYYVRSQEPNYLLCTYVEQDRGTV